MKNTGKLSILLPLSAGFCATVLAVAGGLSANVSYASTAAVNVVGSSSTGSNDANSNIKFEDANLKKALLKTMKNQRLIADNATEITYVDAKKLYHADITNGDIKNLSGIENFTGLNRIDFDHNNISDLSPLSNIKTLKSIYASYNAISNLTPLKSLSSLECLRADNNKIADFSTIENLTNLKTLYLGDNSGITNFDTLKKFTNLTDLNLDDTQFSDLNIIKDLKNLKLLYLQAAKVSDLSPISNLTNLTSLRLYGNQITSIAPLRNLTKLTDLGLEYNKGITDFTPISGLTNLNSLSLTGNNLKSIDSLKTLQKLTYVDISYNDIKDFSVLEKLKSLSSASIGSQTVSLNSDEPSTSLDIDFAKNLTFTAEDTSYGSVKNGSFVLSDNSLPYEGNVTINFNNGKSFKIGSANIDSGKYDGTITLHLNVPKIETVKGKMKYDSSSDLKYGEKKVITQAKNGTKKIYANQPEEIVTNAVDGKTEVGNKEVKTEEIQPGIKYEADSTLDYKKEQTTEGTKGTKTTTTIYKVDENNGLTSNVDGMPTIETVNAKDKVIKVGNVEKKTSDIPFKKTYEGNQALTYKEQKTKTAGQNGKEEVTLTYKVAAKTGLTTEVEAKKGLCTKPVNEVIQVGNKEVIQNNDGSTTTKIYKVNPDDGTLSDPTVVTSRPWTNIASGASVSEVLKAKMTYTADDSLPYGQTQKVSDPQDGEKVTTPTGRVENGKWVEGEPKVEIKAAVNGVTKVGNKQVTHEGDKTITTTYDVDPDTGELSNPKTHTSMPMATLIDPSANPNPNPGPNPGPNPNDNGGGNNDDNNGGESVAPDSIDNPELNIGGGNTNNTNNNGNNNGNSGNNTNNGGNVNAGGNANGVGGNANNGANNGAANGAAANGSANGAANRSGSAKSQATDMRSSTALPNNGADASGATFASFGAMVLGLFAASGAAVNRKRAKHLR